MVIYCSLKYYTTLEVEMFKILNVIQFVLNILAVFFVLIGGKYRLKDKENDRSNDTYYKNCKLYAWIGLILLFISMILSGIVMYYNYQHGI